MGKKSGKLKVETCKPQEVPAGASFKGNKKK